MKRLVATMPGRYGDILWSLPTVRALAEEHDQPIEFYVSKKYGDESFLRLIAAQDYIEKAEAIESWIVEETAPMSPRCPRLGVLGDDVWRIWHLGYPAWPTMPLPYDIAKRARVTDKMMVHKPWITVDARPDWDPNYLVMGWSSEWKELKHGLVDVVARSSRRTYRTHRWSAEVGSPYPCAQERNWEETANYIAHSTLFFGDLSAQWVLACALGTPAIIVEPEPMRHHEIFWVDIEDAAGRKMTRIVKGHDGKPTFDWDHVTVELERAWEEFS